MNDSGEDASLYVPAAVEHLREALRLERASVEYDGSFTRLADILDESFGIQPVMAPAEILTFLERKLLERRREDAKTVYTCSASGAAERTLASVLDEIGVACARVETEHDEHSIFAKGVREGAKECLRAVTKIRSFYLGKGAQ